MHCEVSPTSCEENRQKYMTGIKDDEVKIRLCREFKLSNVPTASVG